MDEWNVNFLIKEYFQIFVGSSVVSYYINSKDFENFARLSRWCLIFLVITALMSIFSSFLDPMYARNLISSEVDEGEYAIDNLQMIRHLGGGTYGTAIVLMSILPILVSFYKKDNFSKLQIFIIYVLFFIALIRIQIFTNIMLAILFSIFSFIGSKRVVRTLFIITLIVFLFYLIPEKFIINNLKEVGSYFDPKSELYYKFNDLAFFIESDLDIVEPNTGAGQRASRYLYLIDTFKKNPLVGCFFYPSTNSFGYDLLNAHLYWMNKITIIGIIGLIFFIIPILFHIKNTIRMANNEAKYYILLSFIALLSYGFFKSISGRETWYTFFIIIPGLNYLNLIKRQK